MSIGSPSNQVRRFAAGLRRNVGAVLIISMLLTSAAWGLWPLVESLLFDG
ncbi:hypothetical protein ACLIYM_09630 [Streptomyces fenghuangensis]|nr:hypothetical protein [Streptomyces sp. ICN903]MCG3038998.1 hypothetical protein [Streptomyces sp. ICN903]